ncbi:MAG: hypothetical protein DWQ07_21505 [Chloroflexi bacterium]|nr:MAG: hypothetical protein DWQ07_21505 [Chloroflexota bacterium]MBL1196601.1 hypothetical protein [Chloroflexota bacterium]NOH13896.1 hypothetical protein [Chloroflexota bacterium]
MNRRWLIAGGIALAVILAVTVYQNLRPQVVEISPVPDALDVPRAAPLRIMFSRAMDENATQNALLIDTEIPGEFTWEENTLIFTPEEGWPRGEIVQIGLDTQALSSIGLPLRNSFNASFEVGRTKLAYLWPFNGDANLYTLDLETAQSQQITEDGNVLDFSPAADGNAIYFSASNPSGGSDLWVHERLTNENRMLLDCGTDSCSNVQAGPNRNWLAYVRLSADLDAVGNIWSFDLTSETTVMLSYEGHETRLPSWSPLGTLSYYDATEQAFTFWDMDEGEITRWDNETGEAGAWSPDGLRFAAPELFVVVTDILRGPSGEAENEDVPEENLERVEVFSSHLMLFNLSNGSVQDLTGNALLEDAAPAFDPAARWLAFARRPIEADVILLGRQLWLVRPNGSSERPITDAPDFKHSNFAWHPEGEQLAYVRFNQVALTEPPEIWLVQASTADALRLVIGAYAPAWVP